jgi:hypothetical protein
LLKAFGVRTVHVEQQAVIAGYAEGRDDVYLHSAVDGYSRLAYTEALPDEKAATAIGFLHRAHAWFAAHGITRIERIVTDNGACYRAGAFARALLGSRHQRTAPYTPRHNGKVERYNRILTEEFLYARTWLSEQQRAEALKVWNIHYNYHRPHSAIGGQPPADRCRICTTTVVIRVRPPGAGSPGSASTGLEKRRCQWTLPGCASWTNWWSVSTIKIVCWGWWSAVGRPSGRVGCTGSP